MTQSLASAARAAYRRLATHLSRAESALDAADLPAAHAILRQLTPLHEQAITAAHMYLAIINPETASPAEIRHIHALGAASEAFAHRLAALYRRLPPCPPAASVAD